MEFKSIDTLSITECCEQLNLRREDLPEALQEVIEPSERDQLLIEQLRSLLDEDKLAIESCRTIEHYEAYLTSWADGLYRGYARNRITQLKAEAEELAFYQKNKNSISGCESYLQKYPKGEFIQVAKVNLANKKKARKMRNIILLIIAIVIAIVICLINYCPVSYLDVSEGVSFGKRGGNKTVSISTDAKYRNIDVQESSDWISVDRDGESWSINVIPNTVDDKTGYITINAYSSFFGKRFNCISRKIAVTQDSGLPTYLKTNTSEISFDKYGNCSSNLITATTDGCDLQVSTSASWFSVSKNITEYGDNTVASIVLITSTNNEGSKAGEVVIRCNDYVERVKVSQASGLANEFRVEKTSLTMPEEGCGEGMCYPINIYTDGTSWSVKSAPSWLTANAKSNRLEVSVGANTGKVQSGTITVMSNNGHLLDISVSQDGDPTNFRAAKSTVRFGTKRDSEYVAIDNDSHKNLEINEYESWLSATAIGNDEIKISCTSNSNERRSGTVYVHCGDEQISITVKQDGWTTCWNCGGHGRFQCQYPGLWGAGGYHYVQNFVINNYTGMGSYVYNPCPNCGGSGTIKCSQCDGTGRKKSTY